MMNKILTIISRFKILITDELPFNINNYLLPFAIIVAICFFVMLIFMVNSCLKTEIDQPI